MSVDTEHSEADFPLLVMTPPEWGVIALADPEKLLNDHAHLERKAALNVLELMLRGNMLEDRGEWSRVLAGVALDEAKHLSRVLRIMERRGWSMTQKHRNPYARQLRDLVRIGDGERELLDRLLVSALIEIRSCERFCVLGEVTQDVELRNLYRSLHASERGHYHVFLKLSGLVAPDTDVTERWNFFLNEESRIIQAQPPDATMHSGWGPLAALGGSL